MAERSSTRKGYLWRVGWRRCIWCGVRLTYGTLTAEHLTPQSKGGDNRRLNLAAACRICNSTRGSMVAWRPHPEVAMWAIRRGLIRFPDTLP